MKVFGIHKWSDVLDQSKLKKLYLELAQKTHPDKTKSAEDEEFKKLGKSKEMLIDHFDTTNKIICNHVSDTMKSHFFVDFYGADLETQKTMGDFAIIAEHLGYFS